MTEALPAATVVLLRDSDEGLEVLMIRRGDLGAFRGVWAFPGGRVEPADLTPGQPDDELGAARRAAARETLEEIGVPVDPERFVPLSRWTPPLDAPRRFVTWFFVAAAPAVTDVVIDGLEVHDHLWVASAAALARRDAGEIELLPPTWVTLSTLARSASVAAALAAARSEVPEQFATRMEKTGQGLVAMWHGDAGYDDGDFDRLGPRHRLSMWGPAWRYERTP